MLGDSASKASKANKVSMPERGRAESVICVGDSAGGNLAAVVALRALEEGIQAPSGVMMIYPALYLHMTPCASRVLSLMDPLLPLGTLQVLTLLALLVQMYTC